MMGKPGQLGAQDVVGFVKRAFRCQLTGLSASVVILALFLVILAVIPMQSGKAVPANRADLLLGLLESTVLSLVGPLLVRL